MLMLPYAALCLCLCLCCLMLPYACAVAGQPVRGVHRQRSRVGRAAGHGVGHRVERARTHHHKLPRELPCALGVHACGAAACAAAAGWGMCGCCCCVCCCCGVGHVRVLRRVLVCMRAVLRRVLLQQAPVHLHVLLAMIKSTRTNKLGGGHCLCYTVHSGAGVQGWERARREGSDGTSALPLCAPDAPHSNRQAILSSPRRKPQKGPKLTMHLHLPIECRWCLRLTRPQM